LTVAVGFWPLVAGSLGRGPFWRFSPQSKAMCRFSSSGSDGRVHGGCTRQPAYAGVRSATRPMPSSGHQYRPLRRRRRHNFPAPGERIHSWVGAADAPAACGVLSASAAAPCIRRSAHQPSQMCHPRRKDRIPRAEHLSGPSVPQSRIFGVSQYHLRQCGRNDGPRGASHLDIATASLLGRGRHCSRAHGPAQLCRRLAMIALAKNEGELRVDRILDDGPCN